MIEAIEHCGKLIDECGLSGETRADWVAPAHGNGLPLSADRFLLLNSTLGFRGVDDNLSLTWQLRADRYDGPLVREGFFARSVNDWDALGDGRKFVRQFGHPVAFGVPRGALFNGQPARHANHFVVFTCGKSTRPTAVAPSIVVSCSIPSKPVYASPPIMVRSSTWQNSCRIPAAGRSTWSTECARSACGLKKRTMAVSGVKGEVLIEKAFLHRLGAAIH